MKSVKTIAICRLGQRARRGRTRRGIVVWKLLIVLVALGVIGYLAVERMQEKQIRREQADCARMLSEFGRKMIDFHKTAGTYTTDLRKIDWIPFGSPRYVIGFVVPHTIDDGKITPEYTSFSGFVQIAGKDLRGEWDHSLQVRSNGNYLNPFDLIVADGGHTAIPQANDACFLAGAAADLDSDPTLDVWTIDCHLDLVHVIDDADNRVVGWPHLDPFEQSLDALRGER